MGLLALAGISDLPIRNLPIGDLRSLEVLYYVPLGYLSSRVMVGVRARVRVSCLP